MGLIHDIPVIHRLIPPESAWRDSGNGVSLKVRRKETATFPATEKGFSGQRPVQRSRGPAREIEMDAADGRSPRKKREAFGPNPLSERPSGRLDVFG
jgi:hypothetical protein